MALRAPVLYLFHLTLSRQLRLQSRQFFPLDGSLSQRELTLKFGRRIRAAVTRAKVLNSDLTEDVEILVGTKKACYSDHESAVSFPGHLGRAGGRACGVCVCVCVLGGGGGGGGVFFLI